MIGIRLQDALNKQINAELFSSYLYLSMSAYFEAEDLKGLAHWMHVQAEEENKHAMRIFDFVNDRSGRVTLTQIDARRPNGSRRSKRSKKPTSTSRRSPA